MLGGICVCILATRSFTAVAISTVFVPGCRWIASTIAREPLNQLATLLFCTSLSTCPMSPSRTGAPFRYVTTILANDVASWSWPFA